MGSVAKVSEISARSSKSFEDAIHAGIARAGKTIRKIESAWVKEMKVEVKKNKSVGYQANLMLTFILEE